MTLKFIGYIPLDASIHSIKTLALHENYMEIFELKIVFSCCLQLDIRHHLNCICGEREYATTRIVSEGRENMPPLELDLKRRRICHRLNCI